MNNLKNMKQQEGESFANYFPKFEKELANAGGGTFQESIKLTFLKSSVNSRFRNCLPRTKYYSTHGELVIDLQNAAANMANEEALIGRRDFSQA